MKRHVLSLLLVLVLALASVAYATSVPSITVNDLVKVESAVSSTGVALPANFSVNIAVESETVKSMTETLQSLTTADEVSNFFGQEAMDAVSAKLPTSMNVADLKLAELSSLSFSNYDAACGDVIVSIMPAAQYSDGDTVVVLVYVMVDGQMTWVPMDAMVVNGEVSITFTQDVLTAVGDGELVFALMSA